MKTLILTKLIERGDKLSIQNGRLLIEPVSGKDVPSNWLKENEGLLIREILELCNLQAFYFDSYTTGRYGRHLASGITLQFLNSKGENVAFACFNVELDRARDSKAGKKGTPLPDKQFRVTKRMEFYQLWLRVGLKTPPRLSSFHDYMGNLKQVVLQAEFSKAEKLANKSIHVLEVSHEQILRNFSARAKANNIQTNRNQLPHNSNTNLTYKPFGRRHDIKGTQGNVGACTSNHGKKLISETDKGGNIIQLNRAKEVKDQTINEWLDDYVSKD